MLSGFNIFAMLSVSNWTKSAQRNCASGHECHALRLWRQKLYCLIWSALSKVVENAARNSFRTFYILLIRTSIKIDRSCFMRQYPFQIAANSTYPLYKICFSLARISKNNHILLLTRPFVSARVQFFCDKVPWNGLAFPLVYDI